MVLDCQFAVRLFDRVWLRRLLNAKDLIQLSSVYILGGTASRATREPTTHAWESIIIVHASKGEAASAAAEKHCIWLVVEFKIIFK